MAKRKAMFRFVMDRKVAIDTQRLLGKMATQHTQRGVAFSHRSYNRLLEAQKYLAELEKITLRAIETDLFDNDIEEREDLELVQEAARHLALARGHLDQLRLRKIDAAVALEQALDPIFAPQSGPKKQPPKPGTPPGPSLTMQPVEIEPPPAPVDATFPGEQPIKLVLDPQLLAKAQRELQKRSES